MDTINQYEWVDFYKEFAGKLLTYKNNRRKLISKIKSIYADTGINMPTLERDNAIVDIDPFTVFGLFNKSSMKAENRIKILSGIAEKFDLKTKVPTSFDSIPVLNNQNATFYYFVGDRGDEDIDELWELFESALKYAGNPTGKNRTVLSKYFDLAINKKGNGNSKITMGLYWIAPDSFLNLDSRNEWYIYESGKLPNAVVSSLPAIESKISSAKYFDIVKRLRAYLQSGNSQLKDFKDLSFEAWKYSQKVNDEKKKAKNGKNQREVKGTGLADEDVDTVHYWLYAPGNNACKWDEFYKAGIMAIGWGGIGDLTKYSSKEKMKQKMKEVINPGRSYASPSLATWQFANEMKPGDVVFVKKGMHHVIGRGVVESDYFYDDAMEEDYQNVRKVKWTDNGEWDHPGQAVMKTLTDITAYTDYVEKLKALFEDEDDDEDAEVEVEVKPYTPYGKTEFLKEVFMSEADYDTLERLVKNEMNVILQGAPGVGKTYAAKRLAYSMIGEKNPERVMMIQFHQSYTYEDFIEGFRPTEDGKFTIKHGSFYDFCNTAKDDLEHDYFFIIDEINRGNISKIFGELFMLIESDKRGNALQLLYSNEKFSVPANVYIIGMMNTADRSLAMLDYALRRRFAFYEMKPAFDTDGFKKYQEGLNNPKFNKLIDCVKRLNAYIADDDSLGEGFCIGHSYFSELQNVDDQLLHDIVEYKIIPLLKEYWYDEPNKVNDWSGNLRSAIK